MQKVSHVTVRYLLINNIVEFICKDYNVTQQKALDMFYSSNTAILLADDDTGLYGQSALFIYGIFTEELANKEK